MAKKIKKVFETPWFHIEEEQLDPKLGPSPFYRFVNPDSVIILPVTISGEIIYIKQYRPALHQFTFEIPAGAIDKGESAISAAQRELYEETGFKSSDFKIISRNLLLFSSRAVTKQTILIAKNCIKDKNFIPQESIEVFTIPIQKFEEIIKKSQFKQAIGIAAFSLAKLRKLL